MSLFRFSIRVLGAERGPAVTVVTAWPRSSLRSCCAGLIRCAPRCPATESAAAQIERPPNASEGAAAMSPVTVPSDENVTRCEAPPTRSAQRPHRLRPRSDRCSASRSHPPRRRCRCLPVDKESLFRTALVSSNTGRRVRGNDLCARHQPLCPATRSSTRPRRAAYCSSQRATTQCARRATSITSQQRTRCR